jgi:NhaA family Na+:H+ antiporter
MALFIAMLAFGEGPALDEAKVGVLAASLCAALAGFVLLRATLAPAEAIVGTDQVATASAGKA